MYGMDCYFCKPTHHSHVIWERGVRGDCQEALGIVIPNGGIAVIDGTIYPQVGDLVICCKQLGSYQEYMKQVVSIGKEIVVGTNYKDKKRDIVFKIAEIRGVVRYVMDDKRNVLWVNERLKEQEINHFDFSGFYALERSLTKKGSTITVTERYCFKKGIEYIKTDLKIKHKPLDICPCCGGSATIDFVNEFASTQSGFVVKCKKCGCSSGAVYEGETISLQRGKPKYGYISFSDALNGAVDKWNLRYTEKTIEQ